jgi:hypothetical protein
MHATMNWSNSTPSPLTPHPPYPTNTFYTGTGAENMFILAHLAYGILE